MACWFWLKYRKCWITFWAALLLLTHCCRHIFNIFLRTRSSWRWICGWVVHCISCLFVQFIQLWYIILQFDMPAASTTANFISLVNACYMFRSYWPSSGIYLDDFNTQNKRHMYLSSQYITLCNLLYVTNFIYIYIYIYICILFWFLKSCI